MNVSSLTSFIYTSLFDSFIIYLRNHDYYATMLYELELCNVTFIDVLRGLCHPYDFPMSAQCFFLIGLRN